MLTNLKITNQMSKKTLYLLGILFTIIIGTIASYYLCCKTIIMTSDATKTQTQKVIVDNATKTPFLVVDKAGSLTAKTPDNFNFKQSYFTILEPVSNAVNTEVLKVKNYMVKDSLKVLHITGYYTASESNSSAFPNLGLARANALKNYFVSTGISSKNINTSGQLNSDILPSNQGIYLGPVSFKMTTVTPENYALNDDVIALGKAIMEAPLVLYFQTGASTLNLSKEQRQKIADISRYIDKVDGAKIKITGHTDNTGDSHSNKKLGQKRADFIKRYLMGNAISEVHILTSSKGQENPIASNANEAGRKANRRVVVTLIN